MRRCHLSAWPNESNCGALAAQFLSSEYLFCTQSSY